MLAKISQHYSIVRTVGTSTQIPFCLDPDRIDPVSFIQSSLLDHWPCSSNAHRLRVAPGIADPQCRDIALCASARRSDEY